MDIHEALYTRMMRRLGPDPVPPDTQAANRRPVHEVSSRNDWSTPFDVEAPQPLWPPHDETVTTATAVGF